LAVGPGALGGGEPEQRSGPGQVASPRAGARRMGQPRVRL
jgi:hypothetical protein